MPLFRIQDGKLQRLSSAPANTERSLQRLIEKNHFEALEIHFLASEYRTTTGGRIDTFGVDQAGTPVIIEYKKARNDNVINQALSYLRWLRQQKREIFEMLVQRTLPHEVAAAMEIDWDHPRVICIAESFSRFDIDTVEVVPIRIELVSDCSGGCLSGPSR